MSPHTRIWRGYFFVVLTIAAVATPARSQARVHARNDVGLSLLGVFNNSSTNTSGLIEQTQTPANAAGGMIEFRHIRSPLVGFEATYSFNRANQVYTISGGPVNVLGPTCPCSSSISADAHELTGDWIVSSRLTKSIRFFLLAGGGLIITQPVNGPSGTQTTSQPAFVYGAGADWELLPHLGQRFQYRGNVHPDPVLESGLTANGLIHSAEPMIGAYFRY